MLSCQRIEGDLSFKSNVGIILPTYCEVTNIGRLIDEIKKIELDASILVIDDSSPDSTADIVRKLQDKHEGLFLFVRPKKFGLGTAITDGFKLFLSLEKPPDYIVTMDSDYSHCPNDIVRLTSNMMYDCDLVIGSRYCNGGKTKDWSNLRLVISKIANFIASIRIGAGISDYTSGFRCYSLDLIKKIIKDLHSQTYEIQIETIRQAHLKGFKIKETPITFTNRKRGKSKLTFNEIKEFLSYILFKRPI